MPIDHAPFGAAECVRRTCDTANAFMGVLAKHGIERSGRMGDPIGLGRAHRLDPRRGHHRAAPRHDLPLHAGALNGQPGLETTETILIKESGPAEALCNIERKLFVKD